MKPVVIVGSLFIALVAYFVIEVGVRPSGPYEPLVSTDFFFDQTGVTKELIFTPRFCRNHEIAILSNPPFGAREEFYWKLRAEVFRFGVKIQDTTLNEESRHYAGKDLDKQVDISFGWLRTLDMLPGKVTIKIHVVKGDARSSKYRENFKVVIRPSPVM